MAKQAFNKAVGVVAGGDFVQTGNVIHMAAPVIPSPKPILDAQRAYLNELVKKIIELRPETPAWQIWRTVHREVGANGIDEMTVTQYPAAVSCLNRLMDTYDEESQCRLMVDRVLGVVERNADHHQRAIHYCIDHYGKNRFLDLKKDQLRDLLSVLPELAPQEPASACAHDCVSCRARTKNTHRIELSRVNVAANKELQELKAKYKKLEQEHEAFKSKAVGVFKQREIMLESTFNSRRERFRQWIMAGSVVALTAGIVLGAWWF